MNTVLLGYWLQTWLIHPLRYWFIYLTNWCAALRLTRCGEALVTPLACALLQDAERAVRIPHARGLRHLARGAGRRPDRIAAALRPRFLSSKYPE